MSLSRFMKLKRFAACRVLFANPFSVHLALSFITKASKKQSRQLDLELKDGSHVVFKCGAEARAVWGWILENAGKLELHGIENGGLRLSYERGTFEMRDEGEYYIFNEIYLDDCYRLASLSERLNTVVDLGGNIGYFAVAAAPLSKHIIAIEAASKNQNHFRDTMAANKIDSGVTLVERAIASESGGTVELKIFRMAGMNTVLDVNDQSGHRQEPLSIEKVSTVSLEDVMSEHGVSEIDYLKIDVEGAELLFMPSWSKELLKRVKRLAAEFHFLRGEPDLAIGEKIIGNLRESGMTVEHEPLRDADGKPHPGFMLYAWRGKW